MPSRNLKTSIKEIHLDYFDPLIVYSSIREEFESESFLLESVEGNKKTARYSFIGFDPIFSFRSKGENIKVNGSKEKSKNPYEYLRELFYSFNAGTSNILPFSGGMVGYFSYDIVRFFEKLPKLSRDDVDLPDAHFIIPSQLICFDHIKRKVFLISHENADNLEKLINPKNIELDLDTLTIGKTRPVTSKEKYISSVEKAKEYIKDGDIFQAVLSRRTEVNFKGDPLEMYRVLRSLNPSPYLFYLDFDETNIIGSSPEMLVRLENRTLTTRPLAGTRPRSKDVEEDEKLKVDLLTDEKERAEHVMLVDLHRNDMGRVSEYGSVKVDELMGIEKYSHVQHIVSNVTSTLRKDMDCFDALKSCFPAGTVSGAPKVRAMEIIEELEPVRRGPYAGVVGYFDFSGNMDFAITIRTVFTKSNKAYLQAGAGIVLDSVPEKEYVETENKMGAMINALKGGGL
jgi:anthranilate synthase component 1